MSRGNFLGITNIPSNTSVTGVWNLYEQYNANQNGIWVAPTPSIVTSGLVLYLDAGNSASYTGTGTTWTNLVTGQPSGTLTNGPTFNSGNGGSFVFDGTNDFVEFGDVYDIGTNDLSINVWIRPTSLTSTTVIASKSLQFGQPFRWLVGLSATSTYTFFGGSSDTPEGFGTTTLNTNTWYMLTFVFTRSSSVVVYINGVSETFTGTRTISTSNGQNFQSSNPFRIGSYTASDNVTANLNFPGNISAFQMYYRSLSQAEITQNFNALRGRFGI